MSRDWSVMEYENFYFKFRFFIGRGVGTKCQQLPFLVRAWPHLIFNTLLYQLKQHQICITNSNMQRNTMSKYNWYCIPIGQKLTAFVFLSRLTNRIWVKRGQLDVTRFIISLFNAQHVWDINKSILRSLRLICWVISWVVLIWFGVCWCYVVVWLWWCGIRMQAEALVPHHHSQTTT